MIVARTCNRFPSPPRRLALKFTIHARPTTIIDWFVSLKIDPVAHVSVTTMTPTDIGISGFVPQLVQAPEELRQVHQVLLAPQELFGAHQVLQRAHQDLGATEVHVDGVLGEGFVSLLRTHVGAGRRPHSRPP